MRHPILCLLLFILCSSLTAQISRFQVYRNLIIQAEQKILEQKIPDALEVYRQVRREHGYLLVRDLHNAALCATKLNQPGEAAQYLREILRVGVPPDELFAIAAFDTLRENPTAGTILKKADQISAEGKKYINQRFRKSLDSLNILRQRFLSGSAADGIRMAEGLKVVFSSWGIPGEQTIGVEKPDGTALYDSVMMTIATQPALSKYHSWLKSTLRIMLDRGCIYSDKAASWTEAMNTNKILFTAVPKETKSQEKQNTLRKKFYLCPRIEELKMGSMDAGGFILR